MTHYQSRSHVRVSLHRGLRLGNYVIERQIGAGSQADVFLARDAVLDRLVALKVFPRGAESANTQSLLSEARLIARLDTPHIVRVYHVEQTPALYYVAIEYVDGGSLEACVQREGVLPAQRAVTHALAMSEGLRHAHDLGIVHSDINPKNLLISHAGQLKIADFGFAFIWESPTSMGRKQMRGTPLYMAPEVWCGHSATPLSDIYSAGACLYYMLTGQPPFPENDLDVLRRAHLERAVLGPVGVPNVLVDLIQQCMAKEPGDRPPSALAVGQALRDYAHHAGRRRTRPIAQQAAPAPDTGAPGSELDEGISEPTVSGLPPLSSSEAEAAILEVPVHAEAVRALAEALASQPPLVVFHGAAAEDLARLLRLFFTHRSERLASLARMEMTVAPGGLLRGIASRLGVELGAAPESSRPILDRICAQRPEGTSACYVQLCVSGALDETDVIELVELAARSAEREITLLVSCDDRDAALAVQAAQVYQLRFVQIALPPMELKHIAHYLVTWTRAATRGRFVWSRDALLLACDALEHGEPPITVRRLEDLATNAIHIAAHAHMRLITSWCVSGSFQHSGRIERIDDIGFPWRRRPAVWPPPEMLSKLAELRTRWPTLGDDSEIEHDHARPDTTSS